METLHTLLLGCWVKENEDTFYLPEYKTIFFSIFAFEKLGVVLNSFF
jgi:hypothetical protein